MSGPNPVGTKRKELHLVLTATFALVTFTLIYLHFRGRAEAVRTARTDVVKIHDLAKSKAREEVRTLRDRLESWVPGTPTPDGFSEILLSGHKPQPNSREVKDGRGSFWVQAFHRQTSLTKPGEDVLRDKDIGFDLSFLGEGKAEIVVTAGFEGDVPAETPDVELAVLLKRGPLAAEPLSAQQTFKVVRGQQTVMKYQLVIDASFAKGARNELVLRTVTPGSPPIHVSWEVMRGEHEQRTLAIGLFKAASTPGAEPDFVIGYAPLEPLASTLASTLSGAEFFRTEVTGDRMYLTDVSGTVMEAVPDFAEKIRKKVKLEGRTALFSAATQRVRTGANADVEVYEGFAKDRVIGAWGPVDFLDGGIIVEREERRVLEAWRGLQAWHLSALLFGLLVLYPLIPPLIRRIREDTELPRLLHYARPFVPHMVVILLAAAVYSAGQGVFAYQGKVVTDEILLSDESTAFGRLSGICWLLAGVAVGMFVVNWVKEYLGKYIQNRLVVELRCVLCEKIANLPMAFHSRQRSGDLLSRVSNDVAETNRGLEMLFGDIITDPIIILGLTASAFVINWRLALAVFVGLPVIVVPISYFGRTIKKYARRRQAKKADVTHAISQMLSGIRIVKAFRMEDHEAKRIRDVSGTYLADAMKVAMAQVTSKESVEFFANLSVALVLGLGGYLVLERQVTMGDLSAFALIIGRMYRASKNLTGNYNKMQESLAGTERIFEVLDTPDTMADRAAARALVTPRTEIAFEDVSFRYAEDGPWVLRHISIRIPVGTSVALVGPTGAGKSTMLDLVARFYDPQEGRVTIDGIDLRDYSRTSLLSHVAVVTQDPFLFNAPISENLRYGKPGATQTELEGAARAAFVHDEILRQAEGYETSVGERGTRLSGGQRQRVTIARAILKDAPILILDEATSALDSRSEKMVQDALANLMKDRTTFVIAHRLSTIQGVDRILVLENGEIVEQGSHEELLRIPDGHYRHLYQIQFASALRRDEGGTAPPQETQGDAGGAAEAAG